MMANWRTCLQSYSSHRTGFDASPKPHFLRPIPWPPSDSYNLENSCASENPRPFAISSRLRIEMFRFPRSTSARKLRSIPTFSDISAWVQPRAFRSFLIRSPKRTSRSAAMNLHHGVSSFSDKSCLRNNRSRSTIGALLPPGG
jgi:hypothetical protein